MPGHDPEQPPVATRRSSVRSRRAAAGVSGEPDFVANNNSAVFVVALGAATILLAGALVVIGATHPATRATPTDSVTHRSQGSLASGTELPTEAFHDGSGLDDGTAPVTPPVPIVKRVSPFAIPTPSSTPKTATKPPVSTPTPTPTPTPTATPTPTSTPTDPPTVDPDPTPTDPPTGSCDPADPTCVAPTGNGN